MTRLLAWVESIAVAVGGPGLFIIAFLDSSFLSFPQFVDLLIAGVAIQQPALMPYYAMMATLGSLCGCFALYAVGRRGGQALLKSRFGTQRLQRATTLFQRYGIWAVIIPSLLPPPAPFKLFVLLSAVTGVRPVPFGLGVLVGRSIRYFGIGLLALWYGRQALDFVYEHGRPVAIAVLILVALAVVWLLVRRPAHAEPNADPDPEPGFDR